MRNLGSPFFVVPGLNEDQLVDEQRLFPPMPEAPTAGVTNGVKDWTYTHTQPTPIESEVSRADSGPRGKKAYMWHTLHSTSDETSFVFRIYYYAQLIYAYDSVGPKKNLLKFV